MFRSRQRAFRLTAAAFCAAVAQVLGGCQPDADQGDKPSVEAQPTTFTRHIAPILHARCAVCHRAGAAAPFSLLSYEDARRRASQIAEVTQNRFMPPWLPTGAHGEFVGDRRLTDAELATIKEWADAGAPLGDESDLPPTPAFADDWKNGPPDLVLETSAFSLSAAGGDVFRNFVVPLALEKPQWVAAVDLRPDNPRVTHHARLGVDTSGESLRRDAQDETPGYDGMAWGQDPDGQLITWAPGMTARPIENGDAWRLHPAACLVLHTHLQPSGKPETAKFRIGLYFAKEPPRRHPVMLRIGSRDIDIPAGAARHVVADEYILPIDIDVDTVFPHAHSLCREVRVVAALPDGSTRSLISIDRFDENWHDTYRFRAPVRLPRGTRLTTTFTYDNTDANVRNRSRPARRVVYGSNATNEMADVYLQVAPVHADQRAVLMEDYTQREFESQLVGYRKTLTLSPADPWSKEGMAACYIALGKPKEAVVTLEERLKTSSPAIHAIVSLGLALSAAGDHASAIARHREAIAIDDEYALAWLGLGKSLAAQRQSQDAEQAFRRAAVLAPGMADAHASLADLLLKAGRHEEAADACKAAINVAPDNPHVHLKAAEISAKQENFDQSLEQLVIARNIAPYLHPEKVLLAVYCMQNADPVRAAALLREAESELPNHPVPKLFLAQLARSQGNPNEAWEYLSQAAALKTPENWPASHRLRFSTLLDAARHSLNPPE